MSVVVLNARSICTFRLHGSNQLIVLDDPNTFDPLLKWGVGAVRGTWTHGILDGGVVVTTHDKGREVRAVVRQNCLHGPVIVLNNLPFSPVRKS